MAPAWEFPEGLTGSDTVHDWSRAMPVAHLVPYMVAGRGCPPLRCVVISSAVVGLKPHNNSISLLASGSFASLHLGDSFPFSSG